MWGELTESVELDESNVPGQLRGHHRSDSSPVLRIGIHDDHELQTLVSSQGKPGTASRREDRSA